ncbi:MAG: Teichoic acid export ATP-binding protein TagH (EC [uncultured Sulfurovum sp.]|uniref:Teichoic acid export ATP-binding protein TagH (EC) n=1 Tax=uncultured Sulfurovum sp. TaxID=269237 RepID=A0A6S6TUV0_9BACT|nr:MAG: Teichoic acid export ATP-binding protein TagH (EC [uncultured Sulfurovum sp.]
MSDIAIKVENLTKLYHLYATPQDRLKEALNPFKKSYHTDFYAMNDVSFSIQKGETVGIVGKNGAGKSTLLKMITGVLTPTHGNVQTNGKISSLLELGAGFNPEMSGFDNIYLNGSLMGFTKEQMDVRLDDIISFADIGEFIHQPVKMYSSGMFARLAFSVAINVDPDILIVDEALSVGDLAFQMKCFKKFQDFQEQGRTILFVTHALDTVIRYCTRGIVIDGGKKVYEGTSKDAVDSFKKILSGDFYESDLEEKKKKAKEIKESNLLKDAFDEHKDIDVYGNHMAQIFDYGTLDNLGNPADILDYNSEFSIVMKVKFHEQIENPIFAFTLKDVRGLEITGTNTYMKHIVSGTFKQGDITTVTFKQNANLQLGKYALSLGCVNLNEKGVEVYNRIYDAMLFEIIGSAQMVGFYDLQSEITIV